jgi:hypothetical protein
VHPEEPARVTVVAVGGAAPEQVAMLELPSSYGWPSVMELVGHRLFVSAGSGLFVVDVSNPSLPTVVGSDPALTAHQMAAGRSVLFAAAGGGGSDTILQIIAASDAGQPRILAEAVIDRSSDGLWSAERVQAMTWSDGRLLMGLGSSVRLYDVSVPVRPALLQEIRTSSRIQAMAVAGCQAVLAAGDGGVLLATLTAGVLPTMGERAYLPLATAPRPAGGSAPAH